MRTFLFSMLLLFASLFSTLEAKAVVIGGTKFTQVIYVAYGPTSTKSGTNSGKDYSQPKGFYDANLWAIPADVVIENVYVVVDTAVAGLTAFNLGDDDTSNGYIASSSGTLATAGLNYYNVDYKGAYLKQGYIVSTAVQAKYYSASGKYLTMDVTGTASAGKVRVIVTGYSTGLKE